MLYTNSPFGKSDFALNFFYQNASAARTAQLACPFFTTALPLEILKDGGCGTIQLLVRLCSSTSPQALEEALALDDVQIRFFTERSFHAKFYVLGSEALVGSANLTEAGLKSNREVALSLHSSNEHFDELPILFYELWDAASVLTNDALGRFSRWHSSVSELRPKERVDGIEPSSPPTVRQESRRPSKQQAYLESFRREYYETLVPNYRLVQTTYREVGHHPDFREELPAYEIDRFMSWTKLTFTTDESLETAPIRQGEELLQSIRHYARKWFETEQVPNQQRLGRLAKLKSIFEAPSSIEVVGYDELMDALLGCAAFDEQLRFVKGGQPSLVRAFQHENSLESVRRTFSYLAFGNEEFVKRIYDCIFSRALKLRHFGRTSVFELFGWINHDEIPPINGRSIKALRLFGFDVNV